jgi:ribosomal protein S18 acetylase RimI-like enzyme
MTTFSTSKGVITIRIAITEDAASLCKLRLEALSMYPEAFAADTDKTASDGDEAWAKLVTNYGNFKSGAMVIACAEEELVGMVGIVRGHWPKTRHYGTLWGVYVKPDWRGFRIGEAIVNGCIEWAIGNNLTVVNLGVNTENTHAIHCYTRCGFSTYGTEPRVIFYNGVYYDEYLMVKLL